MGHPKGEFGTGPGAEWGTACTMLFCFCSYEGRALNEQTQSTSLIFSFCIFLEWI